jgi:hypothetical protein
VNEGTLRNAVTIEDPGRTPARFMMTCTARLAAPGYEIMENICQENNQSVWKVVTRIRSTGKQEREESGARSGAASPHVLRQMPPRPIRNA